MRLKKKIVPFILDIAFYIVGCFVYSFAVTSLVSPNEISAGGFTGISTLINYLTGIPSGIVLLVLNIPLVVLGFINLGGIFIFKTGIATVILSVSLSVTENLLPTFVTDKVLATLFGGVCMGAGLSLVLVRGATTGGIDILAKLINRKYRFLTVGRLMLIMDVIVVGLSAAVYKNIESGLYSAVAIYVSSRVIDTVLYGADKGKIIYAVTDHADELCAEISNRARRGITRLSVTGGYTGREKVMLMCAVRINEVSLICEIIGEVDESAFVVIADAGEIIGEGFKSAK